MNYNDLLIFNEFGKVEVYIDEEIEKEVIEKYEEACNKYVESEDQIIIRLEGQLIDNSDMIMYILNVNYDIPLCNMVVDRDYENEDYHILQFITITFD